MEQADAVPRQAEEYTEQFTVRDCYSSISPLRISFISSVGQWILVHS